MSFEKIVYSLPSYFGRESSAGWKLKILVFTFTPVQNHQSRSWPADRPIAEIGVPNTAYSWNTSNSILILYHQETQMKTQQLIGGIRLSGIRPPSISRTFNKEKWRITTSCARWWLPRVFPRERPLGKIGHPRHITPSLKEVESGIWISPFTILHICYCPFPTCTGVLLGGGSNKFIWECYIARK